MPQKQYKDTAFIEKGKTNTRKNAPSHRKTQNPTQNHNFANPMFQLFQPLLPYFSPFTPHTLACEKLLIAL
jgi:hypothetical protein